jgi:putative addiction module killer protein
MLIEKTKNFEAWIVKLKDKQAKSRILARLVRIEEKDCLGDYKGVGDGVYELRIDCGAGYRVYFAFRDKTIVVLLCGGDKSTQQDDIKKAKIINKEED